MKRTTYIILGMLLAGLVVICGGIFYTSTLFTDWNDGFMNIAGEQKTVQLPECRVVQLTADRDVIATSNDGETKEIRMVAFNELSLSVRPIQTTNGTFTYTSDMDKYMTMSMSGDTLHIVFNFSKEKLEKKFQDMSWLNVRSKEMILALPADIQRITSNLTSQQVSFENLDCDTLSFAVENRATIENCRFRALHVINGNLNFDSGEVKDLHLRLDNIHSWHVNKESFSIDTEYLYAHGNPRCTIEKGECRQVIWMPQSSGATLNINLREAAKIVME